MARLLAGAWRSEPPEVAIDGRTFAAIALLANTKAAALTWWRLRATPLAGSPAVAVLRDAFRYGTLQAEVHRRDARAALTALDDAGIAALVFKGADLARRYPAHGLRPYEDLDLIVDPADEARARTLLGGRTRSGTPLDFEHLEMSQFDCVSRADLFARSCVVEDRGSTMRVLSEADNVRAIALHGLKHGFSDPLWLCDLALCLETLDPNFDWQTCLGSAQPQRQWIQTAFALARDLLGARVPLAAGIAPTRTPRWLRTTILTGWVRIATLGYDRRPTAARELLVNPLHLRRIVRRRWPDSIEVCLVRSLPLIDRPRWLRRWQEFAYLFAPSRLAAAVGRLPAALEKPARPPFAARRAGSHATRRVQVSPEPPVTSSRS